MTEQDRGEARMESLIRQAAGERQSLARALKEVDRLRRSERRSRYLSLRIHAWMGILVGLAILFTGAPSIFETQIGTWMRPFLGILALVAGSVLLGGIDTHGTHGKHYVEAVGLALMTAWYGLMAASLVWSIYLYGSIEFKKPWDLTLIDPTQPRPFGPFIYLGFMSMLALVHLPACWRDLHNRVDVMGSMARG